MVLPRMKTLVSFAVASLALIGSGSDAFAIRNRYTNQQAQGFLPYVFGGIGPFYGDFGYGSDEDGGPAYLPFCGDRLVRPHRSRRPVDGESE